MADDLKALNRRFYDEVFGKHNLDAIDELISEDIVEHIPLPGQGPGPEGVKQAIGQLFEAFPDLAFEILEEMEEGDLSTVVTRMTGTNEGEFMGMPATGRRVSVLGADVARVRDGRFSEHWGFFDQGAMMEQLGVMPGG